MAIAVIVALGLAAGSRSATGAVHPGAIAARVASTASGSQGGTTFDPSTGTVTVNVDLIGAKDAQGNEVTFVNPDDGRVETAKQAWEQRVNDLWNGLLKNGGFSKFLYHTNCGKGKRPSKGFPFHLNFVINPLPPGATGSPDHHHITFVNHKIDMDSVSMPASPNADYANMDLDFPYTGEAKGTWGVSNAQDIAHEVGHLLGLGDDDRRKNNQTIGPFDHRATNTIMYNGHLGNKVNQNLVDRIARQLSKHYKIPDTCGKVYRYDIFVTGDMRYQETTSDPNHPELSGSEDMELSWVGQFNPVNFKLRASGPARGWVTIPVDPVGVVHTHLRFTDSRSFFGGPCSGNIDYPELSFRLAPGFFYAELDNPSADAFTAFTLEAEGAACGTYTDGSPRGPDHFPLAETALPMSFTGPHGLTWDPFTALLAVSFSSRATTFAPFPFDRIFRGKSVEVSSGLYEGSATAVSCFPTPECSSTVQTRMTVSFTRTG